MSKAALNQTHSKTHQQVLDAIAIEVGTQEFRQGYAAVSMHYGNAVGVDAHDVSFPVSHKIANGLSIHFGQVSLMVFITFVGATNN